MKAIGLASRCRCAVSMDVGVLEEVYWEALSRKLLLSQAVVAVVVVAVEHEQAGVLPG